MGGTLAVEAALKRLRSSSSALWKGLGLVLGLVLKRLKSSSSALWTGLGFVLGFVLKRLKSSSRALWTGIRGQRGVCGQAPVVSVEC